MARKVIIDCDPGIDDAVALSLALFDSRLEVMALTATAGNVDAARSTSNVQTIVNALDPGRHPRIGAANPDADTITDEMAIHGMDGLGNAGMPVVNLHHQHGAAKLICDEVRSTPNEVTIISLGPLTNVAAAFQRDPGLPALVDRLIMMGGTVDGIGNVTPCAEFNIHCDPAAAKQVFHSPTTKTLIPLDVTRQIEFGLDLFDELPQETSRVGKFLRAILPYYYRSYHQRLGRERVQLHDAVAVLAAIQPEMFQTREMAGDVETRGELTTGATIFDRRPKRGWSNNMEVAIDVNAELAAGAIVRGLAHAGKST